MQASTSILALVQHNVSQKCGDGNTVGFWRDSEEHKTGRLDYIHTCLGGFVNVKIVQGRGGGIAAVLADQGRHSRR